MPVIGDRRTILLLTLPLLVSGLAGCLGSDTDPGSTQDPANESQADALANNATFGSFDEALSSSGQIFEPEQDSPLRLKLLAPETTVDIATGAQEVDVLLIDTTGEPAPVTDANVTLSAQMVAMGHGTSPEEDPVHAGHGEYHGSTTYSMEGRWMLEIQATLADGSSLDWGIWTLVNQTSETDPNAEAHHRTGNASTEGTVSGLDHNETWSFEVSQAGSLAIVNVSLADPDPVAEVTFQMADPGGQSLTEATLDQEDPDASLRVPDLASAGEHSVRISGQALDTGYAIDVHLGWEELVPPPTSLDG